MWNLTVSVPDHCLFIYFAKTYFLNFSTNHALVILFFIVQRLTSTFMFSEATSYSVSL